MMSSKMPRLTSREVIQVLKKHGFVEASQEGSHIKLFNPMTRRIAIVPHHKGKQITLGTLKSIEKQAGISFSRAGPHHDRSNP